jgi:hypothetical protein
MTMMNEALGTLFEISLRVLLVLSAAKKRSVTADMIAAVDFITVYGKDFGVSDENLHGDNNFKFSEFTVRRENVTKAIKGLMLDGLVTVAVKDGGFSYSITEVGINYCSKFENEYAIIFQELAKRTWTFVSSQPERKIMELINRYSIASVKRGEMNG